MAKFNWKQFGIALLIAFFGFQFLSIILGSFFPVFKTIVSSYQLVWMWIMFAIIILLVGMLVFKMKQLDRKSVFAILLAIAILSFVVIYFRLDFGKLFDMSIVRGELGSIVDFLGSIVKP